MKDYGNTDWTSDFVLSIASSDKDTKIFHLVDKIRNRFPCADICTGVLYKDETYVHDEIAEYTITISGVGNFFVGGLVESEHFDFISQIANKYKEIPDVVVIASFNAWEDGEGEVYREVVIEDDSLLS